MDVNYLNATRQIPMNATLLNDSIHFNDSSYTGYKLTIDEILFILKLRYIVYGWICLPVSIVGLVLNGFTIVVLLHQRMRNFSTNIYLTALSIANIVCLMNYIFLYSLRYIISYKNFILQTISPYNPEVATKYNINGIYYENFLSMILWIWSPIFLTFQLFSIYLTCSVTVDRWIYLLFPFKADRICTKRRTYIVILCIFIFCLLFNLPRWFEVTYFKHVDRLTNMTLYQAKLTDFGENPLVKSILHYYVYIIHVYGIPFFVLLVVNIGIIQKLIITKKRKSLLLGINKKVTTNGHSLHARSGGSVSVKKSVTIDAEHQGAIVDNEKTGSTPLLKKRSNAQSSTAAAISNSSKIDPKITFMVLAVVIAFFICQFPYLIVTILSVKHATKLFHTLKLFSDLLATVSCSVNFLIYCVFGQKFRETSNEILFRKKKAFTHFKSKNTLHVPLSARKRSSTASGNARNKQEQIV